MLGRLKFEITPVVNQILDALPQDVWQSSTTTFLDPAMGGGQFLIEIQRRLQSAGHSVENISTRIYGCEKNKLRVNYAKNNKKLVSKHLHISDFLSHDWGDMKFDVIVGNPPYQDGTQQSRLGSRGESALWPKFVKAALDLLHPGGYMAMIHPTSWRKPSDRYNLWQILTRENTLKKLVMFSGKGDQDIFGIGVRADCYLLQHVTNNDTKTQITDHESKVHLCNLAEWPWLPNYALDEIKVLLGNDCEVLYNTYYHTQKVHQDTPDKKYKYPVVHTINKEGIGIRYFDYWSDDQTIHFGKSKVLLNQNEIQYPYNDYKGEYGMSQLTFGIAVSSKQEGDEIVDFLNTEKGKRIIAATKWNTFYTDYGMFQYFKKDWYKT